MKLKSCPFCNNEVGRKLGLLGVNPIICRDCGAVVSFIGAEQPDKAAKHWNKRATATSSETEKRNNMIKLIDNVVNDIEKDYEGSAYSKRIVLDILKSIKEAGE